MLTFTFIGWLGANRRRVGNHARLSFFARAVALASNRDDDAVVQDAIQDGTRGDFVALLGPHRPRSGPPRSGRFRAKRCRTAARFPPGGREVR